MYLCQSCLGPGAYQVMSYASAARVSRGYMVCARTRVAWLHGLCQRACRVVTWFVPVRVLLGYMVCLALALALPHVAGSASFNAVAFLVYIYTHTDSGVLISLEVLGFACHYVSLYRVSF